MYLYAIERARRVRPSIHPTHPPKYEALLFGQAIKHVGTVKVNRRRHKKWNQGV